MCADSRRGTRRLNERYPMRSISIASRSISIASAAVLFVCARAASAAAVEDEQQCTLYLAKSTIPGAGLGIFTGSPLAKGQHILYSDLAIPIVDIDFHAGGDKTKEDYHWLISDYVWRALETGHDMDYEAEDTSAFVTGLGSMPNCHFRLKNIAETHMIMDSAGITRIDPGVGSFTTYHNRSSYALSSIEAGSELFVDYGINWFLSRESDMGLVPLLGSYPKATRFLKAMQNLVQKVSTTTVQMESLLSEAMDDLLDVIKEMPYKSRPQSAIPGSVSVAKRAFEVGIQQTEYEQSIHALDYLNKHGKCLDIIRPGNSTIPHAGRGAFTTKPIKKEGYISIAPLIHIPEREVLNMYGERIDPKTGKEVRDISQPTGHQLLLNYCFGHNSSTMLLCPYGPGVALINHNGNSPNAKIVWSSDPAYHNTKWLDEPVTYFDNVWHTGLAFEYVAIQDINEGDEIFIDYGEEWDKAWTKHLQQWQPPDGAETYVSPKQLNDDHTLPIPTYDEDSTLLEENMEAWCHFSFKKTKAGEGRHVWNEHDDMMGEEHIVDRIIDRIQVSSDKTYMYTLLLAIQTDNNDDLNLYHVKNVEHKALSFYQRNYKSDLFIRGAFRHEM